MIVATAQELWDALAGAAAGDIIELQTGEYGVFYCPAVPDQVPGVALIPAPGARPVFTSFGPSSNIAAFDMTAELEPGTQYGVEAWNCENVVIHGWKIHQKDGATLAGVGVSVRYARNVMVLDNELSFLGAAISVANSAFVTVALNDYHDIQTDGVLAGGAQHCAILENRASAFHTAGGGHPDAIQWFNSEGSDCFDLAIGGNTIEVGDGDPMQGIFGEDGRLIWITDNAQMGTPTNGLSFSRSRYVELRGNFVQGYKDAPSTPSIIVRGTADRVDLVDNVTTGLVIGVEGDGEHYQPTNVTERGTELIEQAAGPGDYREFYRWLDVAPAEPVAPPAGGAYQVSGVVTLTPVSASRR